jgi:hypothetical protein
MRFYEIFREAEQHDQTLPLNELVAAHLFLQKRCKKFYFVYLCQEILFEEENFPGLVIFGHF